jgi:hypothetical protein
MLYASRADQVKNYEVECRSNASLRDCIRGGMDCSVFAVMSHNAVGILVGKVTAAVKVVMHHKRHWCNSVGVMWSVVPV